jgi:ribonuclease D
MTVQLISTNGALETVLSDLRRYAEIALDLEFDKNYHRYGFNLCLVQVCANDICYLIDPLSKDLTIEHLFPVLEDDSIQKVAFAFGEDLRLLHSLGCFPRNLYDLNIATSLLNYKPGSLASYIEDLLGIQTNNSSQQSNWFQRPLSDEQISYAADDVIHLFTLKNILDQQAREAGIAGWIAEENAEYGQVDYSDVDDNSLIKHKDKKDLSEYEWHLFKKLLVFREELAEKHDKPGFKIIQKDALKELARDPKRLDSWNNTRGIYRAVKTNQVKNQLARLLREAAKEAQSMHLSKSEPADKPLSDEEYKLHQNVKERINQLKSQIFMPIKNKITEDYGEVAASFMLSNRIISDLITGDYGKLESYKRELFLTYAEKLDLNMDRLAEVLDPLKA